MNGRVLQEIQVHRQRYILTEPSLFGDARLKECRKVRPEVCFMPVDYLYVPESMIKDFRFFICNAVSYERLQHILPEQWVRQIFVIGSKDAEQGEAEDTYYMSFGQHSPKHEVTSMMSIDWDALAKFVEFVCLQQLDPLYGGNHDVAL